MSLFANDLRGLTAGEALDRIAKEPDPEVRARLLCEHGQLQALERGKRMMALLAIYDGKFCSIIREAFERSAKKSTRPKPMKPSEVEKEKRLLLVNWLGCQASD